MSQPSSSPTNLTRILPKNGQLICEEKPELIMCKPRLIPLKSLTLQKLENMQKEIKATLTDANNTK